MFNLDQKYESYVRNGNKKLRIDGKEHRVRGYGFTDNGKEIDVAWRNNLLSPAFWNNISGCGLYL